MPRSRAVAPISPRSEAKAQPQRGFCSLFTCNLLANPANWPVPFDHHDGFKRAMGAARGNSQAQSHTTHVISNWILVGALTSGTFMMVLDWCRNATHNRTLPDQILCITSLIGGFVAFSGPVVFGTVMYVNSAACSAENFDLFMELSHSAFKLHERLVVAVCYTGALTFCMLVFTVHCDKSHLWDASPALQSLEASAALAAILVLVLVKIVWHIQVVSSVNLYSGMFSRERVLDLPPHMSAGGKAHNAYNRKVVDGLVTRATGHRDLTELLDNLNSQRMGKLAKGWQGTSKSNLLSSSSGKERRVSHSTASAFKASAAATKTGWDAALKGAWEKDEARAATKIQRVHRGNLARRGKDLGGEGQERFAGAMSGGLMM